MLSEKKKAVLGRLAEAREQAPPWALPVFVSEVNAALQRWGMQGPGGSSPPSFISGHGKTGIGDQSVGAASSPTAVKYPRGIKDTVEVLETLDDDFKILMILHRKFSILIA